MQRGRRPILERRRAARAAQEAQREEDEDNHSIDSMEAVPGPPPAPRPRGPERLPDLPEYLQTKSKLKDIMQDFNANRVLFVGIDGQPISKTKYREIATQVNSGSAVPEEFMRGVSKTFKTAYNKHNNTFDVNKLFIPTIVPRREFLHPTEDDETVTDWMTGNGLRLGSGRMPWVLKR